MRLFIAVNFNDEIKNDLCDIMKSLKRYSIKGNFTRPENLHLTLVFIGEITDAYAVKSVMDSLDISSFELEIGGLGKFRRDGGDIYWVGVKKNESLIKIYNQLCNELAKAGFMIENREYKPHLTLGREIKLNNDFDLQKIQMPDMHMMVSKISLMKSERISGKLVYTEIYAQGLRVGV